MMPFGFRVVIECPLLTRLIAYQNWSCTLSCLREMVEVRDKECRQGSVEYNCCCIKEDESIKVGITMEQTKDKTKARATPVEVDSF
jgi:hypothetical protein